MGREIFNRLTKCNTGQTLNPLMHVFMFITLVFSVGFLIGDPSVTTTALYTQTAMVGGSAINSWGLVGIVTLILHTTGMLLRSRLGLEMLRLSCFGGFYLWLWASVIYLGAGFYFQFLAAALPNLAFWAWYAWQWRRRYKHPTSTTVSAFV